ncbi:helix-turn-helix domain-containing protein [Rhizorhabdus dicambivorans]|uniref:XRE family transcriptional regulator n=1 Tax=Rhizorhabdus dicambivorans TaxID=1850238 RepID=A0A2A4FN42_9SPHN|nr:helix-turn-helix transcriptional regulator [Rhizorhabdus dicambivorans]ATE64483.1 XRE family transcriptional regulator [Rhizorhabdus dicambivorans]PCE39823.1 XRE family transcriptional regulator [Rhizorhabdus dicambivorans]
MASDGAGAEEARRIGERIREELARRRLSRQWLADAARISLSTLEKALAGSRSFTLMTTIRIEEALGLSLRGEGGAAAASSLPTLAPQELGAYARPAVSWLEGDYLTLRPSAGEAGSVYAHLLGIAWDEARGLLAFREAARIDPEFTQGGTVGVSNLSGHVYLVTNDLGQYRLVILGRPTIAGELYGVLTTLQVGQGTSLMPVTMPIALVPLKPGQPSPALGRISPGHPDFAAYRRHVDRVTADGFARMLM